MRFMRVVTMTTPPSQGIAPPERPVPAPRAVTGTSCWRAMRTARATPPASSGNTTTSGEAAVDRRVVFVDEQILGRMQHPMAADCTLEISDQGASLHALSLAVPFVITKAVATPGYAGASF